MVFSVVYQTVSSIMRISSEMRMFTLNRPRHVWPSGAVISVRQSLDRAHARKAASSQNPTSHVCRSFFFFALLPVLALTPQHSRADQPEQKLNYSYLYFENGYPTRFASRRPQSEANLAARANPDLVFQTGYYSLMLGCDDLQIKGYDALAGTDYLTALDQDVTVFTPATSLLLEVVQGGVSYQCTHALT
ncbi:MAG: hypothetical protein RLZZ214_2659, partial [Verrucomicrobiota bacterium]